MSENTKKLVEICESDNDIKGEDVDTFKDLTKSPDINWDHREGYLKETFLHLASKRGHAVIVDILSKVEQVDINVRNKNDFTPLHMACGKGRENVVKILSQLEQLDVNAKDEFAKTPLHHACQYGHGSVVDAICQLGQLDVNVKDEHDTTPLHLACQNNHKSVVEILSRLEQLDVNVKDDNGQTPLHRACGNSYSGHIVEILTRLEQLDVNVKDNDGETVLHSVCRSGKGNLVEILLQLGQLDVNAQDKEGKLAMEVWPGGGSDTHYGDQPGIIHYTTLLILNESLKLLVPASERNASRTVYDIILEKEANMPDDYAIREYLDDSSGDKEDFGLLSKIRNTSANYAFTWGAKRDLVQYIGVENFAYSKATFISSDELLNILEIGSGNFGAIYKADLNISRDPTGETQILIPVVCKIAKAGAGEDEWFELQVLQNLPLHNNVMNLLAMCAGFKQPNSDTDVLYSAIIMNFRKRGSLLSFLQKKKDKSPFVLRKLCSFGIDIVKAVFHMHQHSYKHCDIAARNFLIGTRTSAAAREITGAELQQQLSITDFGLSRPLNVHHGKDSKMPYLWCAPETLETSYASIKSDTWMIGITFLELCTFPYNQPYFPEFQRIVRKLAANQEQPNKLQLLLNHQKDIGRAPSPIFAQLVPIEWTNIMNSCCAISPEERPGLPDLLEELVTLSKEDGTYPGSENEEEDFEVEEVNDPAEYCDIPSGYIDMYEEEEGDTCVPMEKKNQAVLEEKHDKNQIQINDFKSPHDEIDDVYLPRYRNTDLTLEEALQKIYDLESQLVKNGNELSKKNKQIDEKDKELLELRKLESFGKL